MKHLMRWALPAAAIVLLIAVAVGTQSMAGTAGASPAGLQLVADSAPDLEPMAGRCILCAHCPSPYPSLGCCFSSCQAGKCPKGTPCLN